MLGKLLKLEFKSTARLFLLVYAGMIGVALLALGVRTLAESAFPGSLSSILLSAISILFVLTLGFGFIATSIAVISRFYKNMLGDEGYLMFTLPVKTSRHIISKLITSSLWSFLSILVILLSIGIALIGTNVQATLKPFFAEMRAFGYNPGLYIGGFFVILLFSCIVGMILWYAAISIGPRVTHNRLGGTIVAYLVIYFAYQILGVLILFPIYGLQMTELMDVYDFSDPNLQKFLLSSFLGVILLNVISGVVGYFITHRMLDKRLNLN
ncbi:MAG: hypothetical protein LBU41_06230 [Clostridiales Family XIII bacterium]|jgi:hypothetical protein|nr:hypothetical protein [Clostridiales Family XIII bacterium]